jgi:flagellin
MAIVINTNVNALMAQNYLTANQAGLGQAMQRLASGIRINNAADDPAGLAIAASMSQNAAELFQGAQNGNTGISLLQTAEAAMNNIQNVITQMSQIASQAANGVNSSSQLGNLNTQFQKLLTEINRVANNTTFNGINLLSGATSSVTIQVGTGSGSYDTLSIALSNMTTGSAGLDIATLEVSDASGASAALTALNDLTSVTTGLATLGAGQTNLTAAVAVDNALAASLNSAKSRVQDTDYSAETSNLAKYQVLSQANIAMLAQANSVPQMVLKLLG